VFNTPASDAAYPVATTAELAAAVQIDVGALLHCALCSDAGGQRVAQLVLATIAHLLNHVDEDLDEILDSVAERLVSYRADADVAAARDGGAV
jgi:hypothetical protein